MDDASGIVSVGIEEHFFLFHPHALFFNTTLVGTPAWRSQHGGDEVVFFVDICIAMTSHLFWA